MALRLAKCRRDSRTFAGHARLGQRATTSPSARAASELHSGQWVGKTKATLPAGRWLSMLLTTSGITSPARWMTTVHGQKSNFQEVLNATLQVYPELQPALASAR